jgi:hypothetical protein
MGSMLASLPASDLERSKDRGEGRRHRRDFKEDGDKCAVGDRIIWTVDCPLRCLMSRSFAPILI